jgi:hypothetical protein
MWQVSLYANLKKKKEFLTLELKEKNFNDPLKRKGLKNKIFTLDARCPRQGFFMDTTLSQFSLRAPIPLIS